MTTLSKQLSDKTEFQEMKQDRRHLAGLLR